MVGLNLPTVEVGGEANGGAVPKGGGLPTPTGAITDKPPSSKPPSSDSSSQEDATQPFILSEGLPPDPAKLVSKIWKGEFVDMAELLRDNLEALRRGTLQDPSATDAPPAKTPTAGVSGPPQLGAVLWHLHGSGGEQETGEAAAAAGISNPHGERGEALRWKRLAGL